jgi:hypothetical protein
MRLLYRPLLGYVVWKCVLKALGGSWVRWSKLDRTAAAILQKEQRAPMSPGAFAKTDPHISPDA